MELMNVCPEKSVQNVIVFLKIHGKMEIVLHMFVVTLTLLVVKLITCKTLIKMLIYS